MTARTAVRALTVLRVLAAAATPQPAEVLARSLDIPRASLYRLLRAMSDEGFVTHFPEEQRWGLGIATLELGSAYLRADPLARLARPLLSQLVTKTGCTVHLAVLHGNETLYLLVERPRRPDPLVTHEGVRLPAHLTATGRAVLAQLSAAQLRALFPRSLVLRGESGPRDLTDLIEQLDVERRRGWSSEEGLVTPGFASVAAAVLEPSGHPTAAIGVTCRSDDAVREALPDLVVRAARSLTRRLGGRPAPQPSGTHAAAPARGRPQRPGAQPAARPPHRPTSTNLEVKSVGSRPCPHPTSARSPSASSPPAAGSPPPRSASTRRRG